MIKIGNVQAQHNLGADEWSKCNYHFVFRHKLIATASGYTKSFVETAKLYQTKFATKTNIPLLLLHTETSTKEEGVLKGREQLMQNHNSQFKEKISHRFHIMYMYYFGTLPYLGQ